MEGGGGVLEPGGNGHLYSSVRATVFITFLIAMEIKPEGNIYKWEGYELQRGGVELVQPIAVFPSSDEGLS